MKKILRQGTTKIETTRESEIELEINGVTLVSMVNSNLKSDKYYILTNEDDKTFIYAGDKIYHGVTKFTGYEGMVSVERRVNFDNKTKSASTDNPHIIRTKANYDALLKPTFVDTATTNKFDEVSQSFYDAVAIDDLGHTTQTLTEINQGKIAQYLISFNLIAEIESKLGKMPYTTPSGKREWVKTNIEKFTFTYSGQKAKVNVFKPITNEYTDSIKKAHTGDFIGRIDFELTNDVLTTPELFSRLVDDNGFIHFIVYADVAAPNIPSTLITDYIQAEIKLKKEGVLQIPRIPLYEVSQDDYERVLTEWDVKRACEIFPPVDGIRSLLNPYIEVENLAQPGFYVENTSTLTSGIFLEAELRGFEGVNDKIRKREGSWIHVKEWEQVDLDVFDYNAIFMYPHGNKLIVFNNLTKGRIDDFTLENGKIVIPSLLKGRITVIYQLPTSIAVDINDKVYGSAMLYGDALVHVNCAGTIKYNDVQKKYEYEQADRTVYPMTPSVTNIQAKYQQFTSESLDVLSTSMQSSDSAKLSMFESFNSLREKFERLENENSEIKKILQELLNNQ
ncbi:hypothetical protein [Priestia aryabhattai]|uniref:hypothetical protein n=1 Tax=Priestia aryabhattai TaxID=412384 RepID=UPI0015F776A4|nr:hypothetical protein [Priestia aryabhattai]